MVKKKTTEDTVENKFDKKQMVEAKKYMHNKDLLNVLLEASKEYTFSEVDSLINNFMKGKVK